MTTSVVSASDQMLGEDGQSRLWTGEPTGPGIGEDSGSVSPGAEADPASLEAHEEVSSPAAEGSEYYFEAGPGVLAQAESDASAAADLVSEGIELNPGGTETETETEGGPPELLPDAGSALAPRPEILPFVMILVAKLMPLLLTAAAPLIARRILKLVSTKVRRIILGPALPRGHSLATLQRLIKRALKLPEAAGEEAEAVDEELIAEAASAIEVIIGTDDRVRIKQTTKVPWRRYCALRIEFPSGAAYRGTGFFIGERVLATAGHCVYMHDQGGWARRIEVIPACNGSQRPFGSAFATSFKSTAGWIQNKTEAADYGAIFLPSGAFPGQRFGRFGLRAFATNKLLGLPAVLAGYPGDKLAYELWGMKRKIKAATALTLVYDHDTVGGVSGAPLYIKQGGERFVVGIHNYGRASGNSATRVTPAVIANFMKWGGIVTHPIAKPPTVPAKADQAQPDELAMAATPSAGEEIDE